MNVGFVGLGKLGTPFAVAVAMHNHHVIGYDVAEDKMSSGPWPFQEAGYGGQPFRYWRDYTLERGLLTYGTISEIVAQSELIMVCVQTPHQPRYEGDTRLPAERVDFNYRFLQDAVMELMWECERQRKKRTIAVVSTVLPGTIRRLWPDPMWADIVYNPQFLAMGRALEDVLNPEMVVIGTGDGEPNQVMRELYEPMTEAPLVWAGYETAEAIKVLYNTYITGKIAWANNAMELCHRVGANVDQVSDAMVWADRRIISPMYMRGGMGDGGACLLPGEIVITEHGPRPIESVSVGDRVLTRSGRLERVTQTYVREYDGDVTKVSARGLPPTRMTAGHPVFCAEDGRPICPSGKRDTRKKIVDLLGDAAIVEAGKLTGNDLMPWPIPENDVAEFSYDGVLEDGYIELAGWYLSEGTANVSSRRGRISFALHEREFDVATRLGNLLLKLAPPPKQGRGADAKVTIRYKGSHGLTVRYGSKYLAGRLVKDFGKGARHKYIPNWILWGNLDQAKQLMKGLWQGDGHSCPQGLSLSTISVDLAWGAYIILLRCGIPSTVRHIPGYVGRDGTPHQDAYDVRVYNKRFLAAASEITGLPDLSGEQDKLYSVYAMQDGAIWRHVRQVVWDHYKGPVYNLEVENDPSYVTACGAVHNCHPRDNIALSYLARRLGMKFDLFEALMTAREKQAEFLCEMVAGWCAQEELAPAICGMAFKANTNIRTGSASVLCANILREWGHKVQECEHPPEHPRVILIGTCEGKWKEAEWAPGSVIIDPWRIVPQQDHITVISVGGNQ